MGAGLDRLIALMASDCLELPHDKKPNTVSIVTEHRSWHMDKPDRRFCFVPVRTWPESLPRQSGRLRLPPRHAVIHTAGPETSTTQIETLNCSLAESVSRSWFSSSTALFGGEP